MAKLVDNGTRVQYEGGAMREEQTGKGRCDLLPAKALLRLAVHFEDGAQKYGDRNWENGMPKERFVDSAMRHLLKYMDGRTDEPHLVAAAWNLLALLEYDMRDELEEYETYLQSPELKRCVGCGCDKDSCICHI